MNYKIIISTIAVILTFVGYVPYIFDIFKGKTRPHTFTFLVWTIAGFTGWGLQVYGGAGVGSWALFFATSLCFFIFLLSLKYGEKNITKGDVLFLVLALVALFLWLVIKQPVWSVILAAGVELLGFVPTIRKSWNAPYSETLLTYEVCVVRHGLSLFAFQQYNILTVLYPAAWTVANFLFVVLLIYRRKQFPKPSIVI